MRLHYESGRIYTDMLVRNPRLYRKQGVWITRENGERLEDAPPRPHHAARPQPGRGRARASTKPVRPGDACKAAGLETKYPHHRKRWRTTIWKSPKGIRLHAGTLLLGRARGLVPVAVPLPSHLLSLPQAAFLEARLVWDRAARHYSWHLVVEDGTLPQTAPGTNTAAIDLGEIHPAALTDGQETVILSCRALRANAQYTAKRLSELRVRQSRKKHGSRALRRQERRKSRFLAKQKRRPRDMEHKISRAVVKWAKERRVGTLVIGDVRDVADGKRLNTKSQQKIGDPSRTDESLRTSPTKRKRRA